MLVIPLTIDRDNVIKLILNIDERTIEFFDSSGNHSKKLYEDGEFDLIVDFVKDHEVNNVRYTFDPVVHTDINSIIVDTTKYDQNTYDELITLLARDEV